LVTLTILPFNWLRALGFMMRADQDGVALMSARAIYLRI